MARHRRLLHNELSKARAECGLVPGEQLPQIEFSGHGFCEECFLGTEVAIDQRGIGAGAGGDVAHADLLVSLPHEAGLGRVEDRLPSGGGIAAGARHSPAPPSSVRRRNRSWLRSSTT